MIGSHDGDDHENTNDEYIIFKNDGDTALDPTGWTVTDEVDHTYRFNARRSDGAQAARWAGEPTDSAA